MADQLKWEKALELARGLKTIEGFSFDEAAIRATAEDLTLWCTGAIVGGVAYSAEAQAYWLVREAREHWAKWKGTAGLRDLFRARFVPSSAPERQVLDTARLEKEYGKPDPDWSSKLLKVASTGNKQKDHANTLNAVRYQAIRDSLYYTEGPGRSELGKGQTARERDNSESFWTQAMKHHNEKHPEDVAFLRAAIARGELDAVPPLPSYDAPDKRGVKSITEADFAKLKKKTEDAS